MYKARGHRRVVPATALTPEQARGARLTLPNDWRERIEETHWRDEPHGVSDDPRWVIDEAFEDDDDQATWWLVEVAPAVWQAEVRALRARRQRESLARVSSGLTETRSSGRP